MTWCSCARPHGLSDRRRGAEDSPAERGGEGRRGAETERGGEGLRGAERG